MSCRFTLVCLVLLLLALAVVISPAAILGAAPPVSPQPELTLALPKPDTLTFTDAHIVLSQNALKGKSNSTRVEQLSHDALALGWTTIINETFEGAFPGEWQLADNAQGHGEYYWGKSNCRPRAGSYSAWAVGGGADGSSLSCGSNYPNYIESWMVYGPFSLVNATAADLAFKFWLNSELNYDAICWMVSIDGTNFYGTVMSGDSQGWMDKTMDLSDIYHLGSVLGQPQVWIMFAFFSDEIQNFAEGAYVDDILLRKQVQAPTATPTLTLTPTATLVTGPYHVWLPIVLKASTPGH